MPYRPPMPCGVYFCPAPMRMLWPVADMPQKQIGAVYGVTWAELARRADRLGIEDQRPKRRSPSYSAVEFKRLCADEAFTIRQIAARLNMEMQGVRKHARRMGLPPRKGGRRASVQWPADFAAMWLANVGAPEIAERLGCHATMISRKARKMGLPDRRATRWNIITIADYRALQLRNALAARAREEQAALRNAEMVDGRQDARWPKGRAA